MAIFTPSCRARCPPRSLLDLPGPLEVVGFHGVIADYEPHIHISLMDKDLHFFGGHLEEGCSILTLSEILYCVLLTCA